MDLLLNVSFTCMRAIWLCVVPIKFQIKVLCFHELCSGRPATARTWIFRRCCVSVLLDLSLHSVICTLTCADRQMRWVRNALFYQCGAMLCTLVHTRLHYTPVLYSQVLRTQVQILLDVFALMRCLAALIAYGWRGDLALLSRPTSPYHCTNNKPFQ